MAVWRKFIAGRVWAVAATAGAVAVFFATFAIVSALQDEDDPDSPAVSAALTPPGTPEDVMPADLTPATEPASATETGPAADALSAEPAAPEPVSLPLPEFDEASLIHGGDGSEGAILGGPGIYNSSAAENRTDWEVLIPSAQMKAIIVQVGVVGANRALGAPDNPDVVGWWMDGPKPGEPGNVLLAGHRDYTDQKRNIGTGVAWLLPNTQPGDFIILRDNAARRNYLYTVGEATSLPWDSPEGAAYLESSTKPILTFVTCEGSFDKENFSYSNRRIVVAHFAYAVPFDE